MQLGSLLAVLKPKLENARAPTLLPHSRRKLFTASCYPLLLLWEQRGMSTEEVTLFTAVFTRYPELFGFDLPSQRAAWASQLVWAVTVIDTRAYPPRYNGIRL